MLVFFIHGVGTQNYKYSDILIGKIKQQIKTPANFYSSFWGNLFNDKKHKIVGHIERDFSTACSQHPEYRKYHYDIYRYKRRRNDLINDFIGDFLIYQNPQRGQAIRSTICEQLNQFLVNFPNETEIHFVAHSLGSFILWDLLFSDSLLQNDPGFLFRERLKKISVESINTLGSPLLFLKEMLDVDFSIVNQFKRENALSSSKSKPLRWVNIIHSSDLLAYPLKSAIEDDINSSFLFFDQYVWQYSNPNEKLFRTIGQSDLAMVIAAKDAHSSYFYDNLDGEITAKLIGYNLLGKTKKLSERCVTPK